MPYSLTDFAKFCKTLVLENGKYMRLEAHERLVMADVFAGAQETVVLLPKKNGKTSILAALALYHLSRTPDAECVIGASSRDQATILFNQAAGLVRRSGLEGTFDVKGGYREIRYQHGRIRVLAADASTADGVIPTLALVDELHRHPSAELYGVFRDGLGPRDGQMVTISTAGATLSSPLGELRTKAHEMAGFHRDEAKKYNHVKTPDGSFAFHEWCLGEDDDPSDMALVKLVNPASWHTVDKLRRRHESPSTTPWQWLRFACGVWTEGEEPWLEPTKWDGLADADIIIESGSAITLGVDLDARKGDAALVYVRRVGEQVWVTANITTDRKLGEVEDDVRTSGDDYTLDNVVYVDKGFERSADVLESEGFPMLMLPNSPSRREQMAATLFKVIEDGRLRHDGDKEFRAQVLAGRVKESETGWRFVKDPHLPRPICALEALAAAVHALETQEDEESPWFIGVG